jgi:hypothetical protein
MIRPRQEGTHHVLSLSEKGKMSLSGNSNEQVHHSPNVRMDYPWEKQIHSAPGRSHHYYSQLSDLEPIRIFEPNTMAVEVSHVPCSPTGTEVMPVHRFRKAPNGLINDSQAPREYLTRLMK